MFYTITAKCLGSGDQVGRSAIVKVIFSNVFTTNLVLCVTIGPSMRLSRVLFNSVLKVAVNSVVRAIVVTKLIALIVDMG